MVVPFLANHELAAESAPLRMAAVVNISVLTFAPVSYTPHCLYGGDVSPAFYEGCRRLWRGTILIESPEDPLLVTLRSLNNVGIY